MLLSLISYISNHFTLPFVVPSCAIAFFIMIGLLTYKLKVILSDKRVKEKIILFVKENYFYLSALFIVFAIALFIRIWYIPHYHVMFTDEEMYLSTANKIIHFRSFNPPYWKSIGWPFLASFTYIFSSKTYPSLYLSATFSALTVLAIFLLGYLVTKEKSVGLYAATIFTFLPVDIIWSVCAETNVTSIFFVTLTLIFMVIFYNERNRLNLLIALSAIAFTAQIRPENYSLFLLFIIGYFLYPNKVRRKRTISQRSWFGKRVKLKEAIILFFIFALLSMPNILMVMSHQFSENWTPNKKENPLSADLNLKNIGINLKIFAPGIFNSHSYSMLISILFWFGSFLLLFDRPEDAFFLFSYSFLMLMVYLMTWAYSLGGMERLYITFYPIITILAGYSIYILIKASIDALNIPRKRKLLRGIIEKSLTLFTVISLIILLSPRVVSTRNNNLILNEIKYETDMINNLPKLSNCIYVINNPEVIQSTDLRDTVLSNSEFLQLTNNNESLQQIFPNKSCILFVHDLGCDPKIISWAHYCNEIKRKFNLKMVKRYSSFDNIAIYKIISKK